MTHPNCRKIGKSKEFEDVGRVASSFPTYPGKIKATVIAEYQLIILKEMSRDQTGE